MSEKPATSIARRTSRLESYALLGAAISVAHFSMLGIGFWLIGGVAFSLPSMRPFIEQYVDPLVNLDSLFVFVLIGMVIAQTTVILFVISLIQRWRSRNWKGRGFVFSLILFPISAILALAYTLSAISALILNLQEPF